jgi:hypothetical protein
MSLSEADISLIAAAADARLAPAIGLLAGRIDEVSAALKLTNETILRLVDTLAPDPAAEGSPLEAVEAALVGLTEAVNQSARAQIAAIEDLVGVISDQPARPQAVGGLSDVGDPTK